MSSLELYCPGESSVGSAYIQPYYNLPIPIALVVIVVYCTSFASSRRSLKGARKVLQVLVQALVVVVTVPPVSLDAQARKLVPGGSAALRTPLLNFWSSLFHDLHHPILWIPTATYLFQPCRLWVLFFSRKQQPNNQRVHCDSATPGGERSKISNGWL